MGSLVILETNDVYDMALIEDLETASGQADKPQVNPDGDLDVNSETPGEEIGRDLPQSEEAINLESGELFSFINKPVDEVIAAYGEPLRKDLSAYGYTWWIYTNHKTEYIQFGIEDKQVKTIFATGDDLASEPFTIGTSYGEINEQFPIEERVTYETGKSHYTFILKQSDLRAHPLIKLNDEVFVQTYFDTFTNELSSFRVISGDTLVNQRFYEMEFRGDLGEQMEFTNADWEEIEKGMERQVLDISNMYRFRHRVPALVQDQAVREVAYLHSKDMYDQKYFSHDRPDGGGLKERLAEKDIVYSSAGENIAAQYSDAPAAVEGWLNSEGHREALLYPSYSHLGVGVYRLYYTQNFIKK